MEPGDHLIDESGEQTPYRVEGLVASGEHHQIARGRDTEAGRDVVLRTVLYGSEPTDDHVEIRRTRLRREYNFLEDLDGAGVAPEPIEWLEVQASPVDRPPEPVVVCEEIEGPMVSDRIAEDHPEGVEPAVALDWLDQLGEFARQCHEAGWLWRDFDPRRFRIEEDGRLRAVSTGAVVPLTGEFPVDEHAPVNPDYTAPEVRRDLEAQLKRPAADLYGIGALASFVLTGQQPRHRVESPLSYTAHQRLKEHGVDGLELLVARLLQPMAKHRLQSAEQLGRYTGSLEDLPSEEDEGFEDCKLPAPWEGLDIDNPDDNLGLKSQISSGPLVSVPDAGDDSQAGLDWKTVVAVVVVFVAVVTVAVLVG